MRIILNIIPQHQFLPFAVIPVETGIQDSAKALDPRFRGDDNEGVGDDNEGVGDDNEGVGDDSEEEPIVVSDTTSEEEAVEDGSQASDPEPEPEVEQQEEQSDTEQTEETVELELET